jgi:hypothetical protein
MKRSEIRAASAREPGLRCAPSGLLAYEQGIAHRHIKPEAMLPKGIMTSVRV